MSYKDPIDHESIEPHEHLAAQEIGDEDHLPLHPHVSPFWPMFWVFAVLMFLTGLTVWSSNVHGIQIGNTEIAFSGTTHILIAMSIAVIKGLLVAAFFMHLLYDKKVNSIVLASTIFALSLFIGLSLLDIDTRGMTTSVEQSEIYPGGNVSLYRGLDVPEDATGFAGNIVEYAAESAVQEGGNPDGEHGGGDHDEGSGAEPGEDHDEGHDEDADEGDGAEHDEH